MHFVDFIVFGSVDDVLWDRIERAKESKLKKLKKNANNATVRRHSRRLIRNSRISTQTPSTRRLCMGIGYVIPSHAYACNVCMPYGEYNNAIFCSYTHTLSGTSFRRYESPGLSSPSIWNKQNSRIRLINNNINRTHIRTAQHKLA